MNRLKLFLEKGRWKQLKKSDWVVIALAGILLLIIAIPTGSTTKKKTAGEEEAAAVEKSSENGKEQDWKSSYVAGLETELEEVLAKMDGVGDVRVMITVSDNGEQIVEKDASGTSTTTMETDSGGGSRTVTEDNTEETTVYVEKEDETYPYIRKEVLPSIDGIVVVAEGGGNPGVVSDISDAVEALFSVEAHRIKVVKMCSKED